ncbi:MAG: DUF3440 domain-containing protein [Lutibacter sp.]|jgi:predicted phosphoadenosine phosphosulfate sulfurtransferase
MQLKKYINKNVLTAAKMRMKYTFDNFENIYLSFSGGKDSTVIFHLAMEEAIKRKRVIGILLIDFEAQYVHTTNHAFELFQKYKNNIDLHWVCLPIKLRNAVSSFEPTWTCWDPERKNDWVREFPKMKGVITDINYYPFFIPKMEFEEFIVLFGEWYGKGKNTGAIIGIRADESLNRFRTIATFNKETYKGNRWTTRVIDNVYNIYPIYDWKTSDIWKYHSLYPDKEHNEIYDLMYKAGVPFSQQRLCQPYGDDQRRGLWLYHILEPQTWYKLIARVNGVNSGALYIQETGNITGYNKIVKPEGHTYKSFCNLLLSTMPKITQEHFVEKFRVFLKGWEKRGYQKGIPDEAPYSLEQKYWAPSWRRLCKVLLRNDWWCKGLGMTQPKSEAYGRYLQMKNERKRNNIGEVI